MRQNRAESVVIFIGRIERGEVVDRNLPQFRHAVRPCSSVRAVCDGIARYKIFQIAEIIGRSAIVVEWGSAAFMTYFYGSFLALVPQTLCTIATVSLLFVPFTKTFDRIARRPA